MRWLTLLLVLVGCRSEELAAVVVTIQDPSGAARSADQLAIGPSLEHPTSILAATDFPITLTLTSTPGDAGPLWITALEGSRALARGVKELSFVGGAVSEQVVALRAICAEEADCIDDAFCNGVESCVNGLCTAGTPPCRDGQVSGDTSEYSCVVVECVEERDACSVVPDSRLDDGNTCTKDLCGSAEPIHVVDPAREGSECSSNGGAGRCTNGVCVSLCGDVPLDDANPCTLDLCGTSGVEHVPDPAMDGSRCLRPGEAVAAGRCRAGMCEAAAFVVVSELGRTLSQAPSLDREGRYLVFRSFAQLTPDDLDDNADLYRYDRETDRLVRVPASDTDFGPAPGDPQLSGDGTTIGVTSANWSLVPEDLNGLEDTFITPVGATVWERVSLAASGAEPLRDALNRTGSLIEAPAFSRNGRVVAFSSRGLGLTPDDQNHHTDVFLRDRDQGATILVSRTAAGPLDGDSMAPSISDDGNLVVYLSRAPLLTGGAGRTEAIHYDRGTGQNRRVSVPIGPVDNGAQVSDARISADGRWVVFTAWNALLPADTNDVRDVYLWEQSTGALRLLSRTAAGTAGSLGSLDATISEDGALVLFESSAPDLEAGQSRSNLYLYDRLADALLPIDLDVPLRDAFLSARGEFAAAVGSLDGVDQVVLFRVR